ncbi:MAG: ABC transporter ATP-binding protein/permease [Firmicutes bacterium]|nr:ABC transporter ATP-binding protein/permease [Bacillota bacterium]
MGLIFKTLSKHHQRYKGFLVFYLFLALVISVATVIGTRITGDMAQAALDFDTATLLQFLGIITGLMVIRVVASGASALLLGRFAGRAGYRFRDNFAKYFLQKPFAKFEGVNSGESLSVYANDLPAAVELVSNGGLRFMADIISLVVTFVYMLTLTPFLTLIFFASFPVLAAMQIALAIPIQKKQIKRSEARAELTAVVNDSLQNTSTIAAYSLEEVMKKRCTTSLENVVAATKGYASSLLPLVMAGQIASLTPLLIVIAIAANRVIGGTMNVAEFVAFLSLAGEAGSWLAMLSQRQNNIQTAAAGAKRLMDTMDGEEEDFSSGKSLAINGGHAIAAANLSFAYPERKNGENHVSEGESETSAETEIPLALDNVSFQINKGSRVAFVGGSGSGKSTVLKLLLGLYQPQSGSLSVMDTDISDISLESLRGTFAYVPQDSFLFPESIGANITGDEVPTDMQRLEKACKDAGILEFILNLPDKFNAVLSESAENISGGQKQRIALARAFYRNAPIILFDEATSALDPSTEAAVLKSFDALGPDTTVVLVSHRVKPISFCDTIIVMDNGKIAAIGSHDQLLNTCPVYKNLFDSQTRAGHSPDSELLAHATREVSV